jgi:hypothetical protein
MYVGLKSYLFLGWNRVEYLDPIPESRLCIVKQVEEGYGTSKMPPNTIRESDEYGLEGRVYRAGKSCTDLQVGKGRVQHFTQAQTRKTGKMISTMAQLKNCCLGGVRERQEGEEKQRQFVVLSFPLFSLFLILTNKVYL